MDSLVFEMLKQYDENRLQLVISPVILYAQPPQPQHLTGGRRGVNTSHDASHGSSSEATHTTLPPNASSASPRQQLQQPGHLMLSGLQVSSLDESPCQQLQQPGHLMLSELQVSSLDKSPCQQLQQPGHLMLSGLQVSSLDGSPCKQLQLPEHLMLSGLQGCSFDDKTYNYFHKFFELAVYKNVDSHYDNAVVLKLWVETPF